MPVNRSWKQPLARKMPSFAALGSDFGLKRRFLSPVQLIKKKISSTIVCAKEKTRQLHISGALYQAG